MVPPKWAGLRYIRQVSESEWHSECPQCGTVGHTGSELPDRFVISCGGRTKRWRGWCRRCGYFSWSDEGKKPSAEKLAEWRVKEEETEKRRKHRQAANLFRFSTSRIWARYYKALRPENIYWWEKQGIPRKWQNFWLLGYVGHKNFKHDGKIFSSPAYTIPIFDIGWKPRNLQYRLLKYPDGAGKYRGQYGLPPFPFIARPDIEIEGRDVIIVEGAKKAMVLYIVLSQDGFIRTLQVIGLPGMMVFCDIANLTRGARRTILMLDPEAYIHYEDSASPVERLQDHIGLRALSVRLPKKPDDLILSHGWTREDFCQIMKSGL